MDALGVWHVTRFSALPLVSTFLMLMVVLPSPQEYCGVAAVPVPLSAERISPPVTRRVSPRATTTAIPTLSKIPPTFKSKRHSRKGRKQTRSHRRNHAKRTWLSDEISSSKQKSTTTSSLDQKSDSVSRDMRGHGGHVPAGRSLRGGAAEKAKSKPKPFSIISTSPEPEVTESGLEAGQWRTQTQNQGLAPGYRGGHVPSRPPPRYALEAGSGSVNKKASGKHVESIPTLTSTIPPTFTSIRHSRTGTKQTKAQQRNIVTRALEEESSWEQKSTTTSSLDQKFENDSPVIREHKGHVPAGRSLRGGAAQKVKSTPEPSSILSTSPEPEVTESGLEERPGPVKKKASGKHVEKFIASLSSTMPPKRELDPDVVRGQQIITQMEKGDLSYFFKGYGKRR